ncbi:MAG: GNAT family N-acetyltransferase [Paracoccaceae bacterium]|nr:GNAT family N-acetyltransferase [Paracoccaceae bacterium]
MIVRLAEPSDAEAITLIQNPVIRDTAITFNSEEKTPEMVRQAIRDCRLFLVAEEDGALLGFASYDQFRRGVGYARAMEHTIVLAPEARGKGAGRALMQRLEAHARAAGVGSLWAGVSGENPHGVAFHARLGFEEIARLPKVGFKFGRWMDLVLMRKWLAEDE